MTATVNGSARTPVTDIGAWVDALPPDTQRTLLSLGELLVGVADRPPKVETAEQFTYRNLAVNGYADILVEDRDLTGVSRLTVALALADAIEQYGAETGPGNYAKPPAWMQTTVGDVTHHHPQELSAAFPAGTLAPVPIVLAIQAKGGGMLNSPEVSASTAAKDQQHAIAVLDALLKRADELHPWRGRVVRATDSCGLTLSVIDLPSTLSRETVILGDAVWQEIDLAVSAVRDQHELLNRHGLGARRGVLLVGPPGVGKSAVSAVVAKELVRVGFTAIYVEARAGANLLTAVVEEALKIGGPVLLILEDVDLWCGDRRGGGGRGLSELLQAMDFSPEARILALASTNDASTLDGAAIRTGRFDSVVEVGYPTRADAACILTALLDGLPGAAEVDTAAVASRLPERTSGSDAREIVRRAVLAAAGAPLTTAALTAEIGSGRYRAQVPDGQYL